MTTPSPAAGSSVVYVVLQMHENHPEQIEVFSDSNDAADFIEKRNHVFTTEHAGLTAADVLTTFAQSETCWFTEEGDGFVLSRQPIH